MSVNISRKTAHIKRKLCPYKMQIKIQNTFISLAIWPLISDSATELLSDSILSSPTATELEDTKLALLSKDNREE